MSQKGRDETMSIGSSMGGDESMFGDIQGEERIFVCVRMRPLNEKEIARHDVSDWECINDTTIIFKSNMPDRSMVPTAYTFDRVYGSECPTKQVYEGGAKEIALAAVSGINSSIFAYGQTSSGKTYTMSGITECAMADIYQYIEQHKEREFVLKFSAMEIYNEAVRDLLSADSTPLRLLDDPETVESAAYEYSRAANSSTLTATVNFVDLAGSERASQTLAAGVRLKEGSHINRSLLTLGTVIRKLSKGRNGHIPYRDSKLTRILHNSLGGNARTAMICTISPSRNHVEQTRNTLLFASCAKEVTTNAQVNVLMSDKALVKQLQKELTRLESRLMDMGSISATGDTAALLREKEVLIEQMKKEIKDLTWQRDLAQARIESLLRSVGEDRLTKAEENSASESSEVINPEGVLRNNKDFDDPSVVTPSRHLLDIPDPEDNFLLDDSTPQFSGLDSCRGWENISPRKDEETEDICKEVRCVEAEEANMNSRAEGDMSLSGSEEKEVNLQLTTIESMDEGAAPPMQDEDKELNHNDSFDSYDSLKRKIQELHDTISRLQSPSNEAGASGSKGLTWIRSRSRKSVVMTIPSDFWSQEEEEDEDTPPAAPKEGSSEKPEPEEDSFERPEPEEESSEKPEAVEQKLPEKTEEIEQKLPEKPEEIEKKLPELKHYIKIESMCRKDSTKSISSDSAEEEEEETIKEIDVDVDDTTSVLDFVARMNVMSNPQSEEQIGDVPVPEVPTRAVPRNIRDGGAERGHGNRQNHSNWAVKFERYRRKIIDLWVKCNVPLVHRSYFFLLFKGDPSDNVYMEVELRRLYFLKDTSARGTNAMIDTKIVSPASSLKALNREREYLARQIQKKFTKREREELYLRWGIDLDTKQRSLQLTRRLWTDTKDMKHMRESSLFVAKLVGFVEPRYAPKEMFGLSFITPSSTQKSSSWRDNMSSLL
ncbi:hypothetical protein JCGZ_04515 [Jatropha curcas]|uniref:Kinesin-like protein n=1 Tax=Jatropha curcas TaxID=180498 RepID=A0A067L274_JATCU|nr:hypothetical protein JCGZ_04515 [Jatropha curcas]